MKQLLIMAAALASTAAAAADAPSLLRGPIPTAPLQDWIAVSDFPADTLKSVTAIGPASFALTISAKGRVTGCTVERSSGSKPLDDTSCYIFEQRGRFQPAADSLGKPAIGIYRVDAQWALAGQAASVVPLVEMVVTLQKMPQPLSDPAYVEIAVSVDETGRIDGCAPAEALDWAGQPIAGRQEANKALGDVPCAQALKSLRLEAAKTDKSKPVRSVQMATVLFTANLPALAASAAPAAPNRGMASASPPPPVDPDEIVVEGRNIKGIITRPEAKIPFRGSSPIVDFEPVGFEALLLKSQSGQWYRATLEPPCIGNSRMTSLEASVGVEQHPDGSVDYRSAIFVRGDDVTTPDGRCQMISLVESAPPKGSKQGRIASWALKPPPPVLNARAPVKAPDGGPVYPVEWQERPTPAQFKKMASGWSGSGWIMCKTAADYKLSNCSTISESPRLSGVASRMKLEAGKFRVKPPTVDGRPLIGAWVAIGFDFNAKRRDPVPCNPLSDVDPC